MGKEELLRAIPNVNEVLARGEADGAFAGHSRGAALEAVRAELSALRGELLSGARASAPGPEEAARAAAARLARDGEMRLRPAVNAAGVVLHTNLGRAPLAERAVQAVAGAARGYCTVEYDLEKGTRGSRQDCVEPLLRRLTGAEAAMAVNNNAAAVLLMLSTAAAGREVVISRGQLVEIGGAFRVPEVMEMSGCRLREVGTTNKTRLSDYEAAVGPDTAALLRVHTSNFRVVGFTEETPLSDLVRLGREKGIPVLHDVGSGALLPLSRFGLADEPTVPESVAAGADLTAFSGDKLLGGPQAGILVGKKEWIDRCRRNPLARALRIGKLPLAGLEATLRLYLDPEQAVSQVPALRMLALDEKTLDARARALAARINALRGTDEAEAVPSESQAGGGSVPGQTLPSRAVAVSPREIPADELDARLRRLPLPVVGYIWRGRLMLDLRTIAQAEDEAVAAGAAACLAGESEGKA